MRRIIALLAIVVLVLALAPPAHATSGIMYIASDTTLTEDHHGTIVFDANDITLDCDGHTVYGPGEVGFSGGIDVASHSGVTIENCVVTGFDVNGIFGGGAPAGRYENNTLYGNGNHGIHVASTTGSVIVGNESYSNGAIGIVVTDFVQGEIANNTVHDNLNWAGIALFDASNANVVHANTSSGNVNGFEVIGSLGNTLEGNTATGNLWGGVVLADSTENVVRGNASEWNMTGLTGFDVYPGSSDNVLVGNRSAANDGSGFYVWGSTGNLLRGNRAIGNADNGIQLVEGSDSNTLQRSTTARNTNAGISLQNANGNLVTGSISEGNAIGVSLSGASRNVFTGNQFIDNAPAWGVWIADSSNENRFEANISRGNEYENFAIAFGSSGNELVNNVSRDSGYEGISLYFEAEYNVVRGNVVTGNATSGVLAHDSNHNIITGNRVMANNRNGSSDDGGIALRGGSSFNAVTRNVACGNGNADAYEDGSGQGNLWQANRFCTTESLEPPVCIAPPEGLIGWWSGDDTTADLVDGHDATLVGDAMYGSGKVDRSFVLDGNGDYVDVAYPDAFNFGTGEFTVDLWVRFNDLTGEQVLAEKWIQRFEGSPSGWTFTKLEDNSIVFATSSAEGADDGFGTDPLDLPTLQWIHLAVVRGATEYSIYMNGELVASTQASILVDVSSTATLKFGHRGNPTDTPGSEDESGFYLNGKIDEVEVLDRALSPDEIRAIWEAGSAGKCKA